jgi:ribose transport system ATP-binding protein
MPLSADKISQPAKVVERSVRDPLEVFDNSETLLEMKGIVKDFPGQRAVDNVDFSVQRGEIHALVGANGAGKSTLIKILAGLYSKDKGEIWFNGKKVDIRDAHQARLYGLSFVHQELCLVPYFNAIENFYLGLDYPKKSLGLIDWIEAEKNTKALVSQMGMKIDVKKPVSELSVADCWMITITRGVMLDAKLIILDEPTSALTKEEIDRLFSVIRLLREKDVSIVYISHRMKEVFELADRVTVMKAAKKVATVDIDDVNMESLVAMIAGTELKNLYPKEETEIADVVLSVRGLRRGKKVRDVSFDLRKGEILGLTGLIGAGRSEVARMIFGADRREAGEIILEGTPIKVRSPEEAIRHGLALIPEERRTQGLILPLSIKKNVSLANLRAFLWNRWLRLIDNARELNVVRNLVESLQLNFMSLEQSVNLLSGGNQQKVVLAKWLCSNAKVFIFDEPTRGIDVQAKTEFYRLMEGLANEGAGVIFISSELPEIVGIADRTLVMREGCLVGELSREKTTEEKILGFCYGTGGHE